jgi:hypothetical protein
MDIITGFSHIFHRPVFYRTENTMFQKPDMFPPSGEGGEKTPTQLGPLERANLNHWIAPVRYSFRNVVFSIYRIPGDGKSSKTQ